MQILPIVRHELIVFTRIRLKFGMSVTSSERQSKLRDFFLTQKPASFPKTLYCYAFFCSKNFFTI